MLVLELRSGESELDSELDSEDDSESESESGERKAPLRLDRSRSKTGRSRPGRAALGVEDTGPARRSSAGALDALEEVSGGDRGNCTCAVGVVTVSGGGQVLIVRRNFFVAGGSVEILAFLAAAGSAGAGASTRVEERLDEAVTVISSSLSSTSCWRLISSWR